MQWFKATKLKRGFTSGGKRFGGAHRKPWIYKAFYFVRLFSSYLSYSLNHLKNLINKYVLLLFFFKAEKMEAQKFKYFAHDSTAKMTCAEIPT